MCWEGWGEWPPRRGMWGRWERQALGGDGRQDSLQLAGSSLPSTQSLSRSQTQTRGMQRLVMEHWNWLGAQVTSAMGEGGRLRTCHLVSKHNSDHQLLPLPSPGPCPTSNSWEEGAVYLQFGCFLFSGSAHLYTKHDDFMSKPSPHPLIISVVHLMTLLEGGRAPRRSGVDFNMNGVSVPYHPLWPRALTAVPLVLPVPAVVLPVAAEDARNTAVGVGALELTGQAHVDVCGAGGGEGDQGWIEAQGQGGTPPPGWEPAGSPKSPNPGGEGSPLPQLASSLLSWQSLSPSQMKAGFVQMPVEHWNCPGRHLNSAARRGGSASQGPGVGAASQGLWSQAARRGTLSPPRPGHSRQSGGSSEWSPQSSSVSHFHQKGMHLSFLHTNWRAGGARGVGGGLGNSGGFLLGGWDVSKKRWGYGTLGGCGADGRLVYGEHRKARRGESVSGRGWRSGLGVWVREVWG